MDTGYWDLEYGSKYAGSWCIELAPSLKLKRSHKPAKPSSYATSECYSSGCPKTDVVLHVLERRVWSKVGRGVLGAS